MNGVQLIQATMLALTRQNVTPRPAPLADGLMQGICINRNISAGERVCCYYNDSGELTWVGSVPQHNGSFFIDENNKMYTNNNGVLRIQNGLTGEVLGEGISIYRFIVEQNCLAIKTERFEKVWRVIFPDGEMSDPIEVPDDWNGRFAYRNGVLAYCYTVDSSQVQNKNAVLTYRKNGTLVNTLTMSAPNASLILPLSYTSVALASHPQTATGEYTRYTIVLSGDSVSTYNPFSGYSVWRSQGWASTELTSIIGNDDTYIYAKGQLTDPEDQTIVYDKWIVIRFAIDSWQGSELVEEYEGTEPKFLTGTTNFGNLLYQEETTEELSDKIMFNLTEYGQIYANDLPDLSAATALQENEGYIWIEGVGVYQKTQLGWLMYPTSRYPRQSPWGKLGYAVRNVKVGENGLAIVLFE